MNRLQRSHTRRGFLKTAMAVCGLSLSASCRFTAPWARSSRDMPRIGVLLAIVEGPTSVMLQQALAELGYIDGRNIRFEWRADGGSADRMSANAAELLDQHVELIVAFGTQRAVTAKQATETIPIVLASGMIRSEPV